MQIGLYFGQANPPQSGAKPDKDERAATVLPSGLALPTGDFTAQVGLETEKAKGMDALTQAAKGDPVGALKRLLDAEA